MNKFQKRLALWLIDREITKYEKKAFKAWQAEKNYSVKKNTSVIQYIEDKDEYRRIRELRFNIQTINSPWTGVFNPYFKLKPKNDKHVEKFEELEWVKVEPLPLNEEDQKWADLGPDEFLDAIDNWKTD